MPILKNIFGKQKNNSYATALDIGTEFVKALVFKIEDGKGHVVGVGRQRQGLEDMHSGAVTDIAGVINNCAKALSRAEEMAGVRADQAVLGIAGEMVKGQTTYVHYERLKPQAKIDLAELKNIVHKVQWKAFDQVRQQLAWETGRSEVDVKLVNAAIVDVKIDGYRVTNPLGFQGKDVTVGIFNAFATMVNLGALQTNAKEIEMDILSIAAEPYAVARCVGGADAGEFSAVFIDIGGGTTDIAVVRNGGVEGTKMFALGGRAFTKRLAQTLNVPFDKAEEIKIGYSNNMLNKKSIKVVKDAVAEDCEVWASGVELALQEFSNVDLLPARILLCGGGSGLPDIGKVLQKESWRKELPFARAPQLKFIKPHDVSSIIDKTGLLVDQQDITPMGLANIAIDLAGAEEVLSGILRRVIKIVGT
jgi:cell division protein FtsA